MLARLQTVLPRAADPVRAEGARAYMRHQFEFLGIPAPRLTQLMRGVVEGLGPPTEADLLAVATRCWALPEREYQYFACSYLRRYVKFCSAGALSTLHDLIVTKSWWDTVDTLASHTVGPLVAYHPGLRDIMDAWIAAENMWLVRTAILYQLGYKRNTDAARLFRYSTAQSSHRDFFIRKAIGWALRDYAWHDPRWVERYVARLGGRLSPLSRREATKHVARLLA